MTRLLLVLVLLFMACVPQVEFQGPQIEKVAAKSFVNPASVTSTAANALPSTDIPLRSGVLEFDLTMVTETRDSPPQSVGGVEVTITDKITFRDENKVDLELLLRSEYGEDGVLLRFERESEVIIGPEKITLKTVQATGKIEAERATIVVVVQANS